MASTPKGLKRGAAFLLLAAAAILVSGCSDFSIRTAVPPDAATTQGQAVRNLYDIVFVIGAAIFVLVEGLILFAVLRYRRRPGDNELPPQIHGNNRLEIVWTAIPIAIVLALFVLSWQTLNTIDARKQDPALRIGVVAYQWQWQFVYAPSDIKWEDCNAPANKAKCVTVFGVAPPADNRSGWQPPQLHVPVNETVELQLHSIDVIHSFYVPAFLYQRDITPGRDQVVQFLADREGTYRGQCTQFCGLGHQGMAFDVVVESQAAFSAFIAKGLTPASPSPAPSGSAAPSGSPAASGSPSGPPAASGAPGPSAAPPAASGAPGSAAPGGATTLTLSASGLAYDTDTLTAPANTPFQIAFTNNDAGIPHNVSIHQGSPTGAEVWRGEIFSGVDSRTYQVPALPAGTYGFVCSVHPNMTGTLTVR